MQHVPAEPANAAGAALQSAPTTASHALTGLPTLGVSLRAHGSVWLATAALFAYYVATMARDLSLYDSGELTLAAVQLGLGHPPGQPLHALLGFALSHLPAMPHLLGAGLASALPGALTLVPASSLGQTLAGPGARPSTLRAIPWCIAGVALHASLWEPATRVEVYALATFFAVWACARLAEPTAVQHSVASDGERAVLQAGIALGLCACVNPMIALCTGLALAPAIVARMAAGQLRTRALALAVAGGVLGLLPYVYLPLVVQRHDVMLWGAPRDAGSVWRYLSLRDYAHNQQITAAQWLSHGLAWLQWATTNWLLPVLGLGLAGHLSLGRRSTLGRSAYLLLSTLLVAAVSFNVVWNLDVPDYNGYVASALWLAAAGAAAFCAEAFDAGRRGAAMLLALCLLLASFAATPNVFARTRCRDHLARRLAEQVLHEAPRDALVIAEGDLFAGAFFYLQEEEHQRPDVSVLVYGLASSSWHWERIAQLHPQLSPFALRGPGGKSGRVQRWLHANAQRAVLLERFELAQELGLRACVGGLYLRTGTACADEPRAAQPIAAKLLGSQLALLGEGSPSAAGAIADVAYFVGESLWRAGAPRLAFVTLLAGVPNDMLPKAAAKPAPIELEMLPTLTTELPRWQRGAALGDPARNLFLAASMLAASAGPAAAVPYLRAAADAQLPEAVQAFETQH